MSDSRATPIESSYAGTAGTASKNVKKEDRGIKRS